LRNNYHHLSTITNNNKSEPDEWEHLIIAHIKEIARPEKISCGDQQKLCQGYWG